VVAVVQVVADHEPAAAHRVHPQPDGHRLDGAHRSQVLDRVADHQHPGVQQGPGLRRSVEQEVDARLLQIVDVEPVVDVTLRVQVAPADRTGVRETHQSLS
jgi:hypothetical protein